MKKVGSFTATMICTLLLGEVSGWAQNQAEGRKLYASYCSTCHGEKGKGDGMAAKSLPAKPADHTNGAIMNQMSDKFLVGCHRQGGQRGRQV